MLTADVRLMQLERVLPHSCLMFFIDFVPITRKRSFIGYDGSSSGAEEVYAWVFSHSPMRCTVWAHVDDCIRLVCEEVVCYGKIWHLCRMAIRIS